jgi:hypothetical protein
MSRKTGIIVGGVALALVLLVTGGLAYECAVGYPRTYEGKRVHRVTRWFHYHPSASVLYRRSMIYYAYTDQDGKETNHGPMQTFHENGRLAYLAYYKDGQLDGPVTWWNAFGDKTNEVFYHHGRSVGWAIYAGGNLSSMRQDIYAGDHPVAMKIYYNGRYLLNFYCGEAMNQSINPTTGETRPVSGQGQRVCR